MAIEKPIQKSGAHDNWTMDFPLSRDVLIRKSGEGYVLAAVLE
jgi:hypothetical protein